MKKAAADKAAPAPSTTAQLGFEDALKRLTAIVERLESGDLSLEQSLALFEEGTRLSRSSQAQLDAAEKRVEELLAIDASGQPIVRELEPE
jgi:exodeoxyribonuclease VII small subunit